LCGSSHAAAPAVRMRTAPKLIPGVSRNSPTPRRAVTALPAATARSGTRPPARDSGRASDRAPPAGAAGWATAGIDGLQQVPRGAQREHHDGRARLGELASQTRHVDLDEVG